MLATLPKNVTGIVFSYFDAAEKYVLEQLDDIPEVHHLAVAVTPSEAATAAGKSGWDEGLKAILSKSMYTYTVPCCAHLALYAAAESGNLSTLRIAWKHCSPTRYTLEDTLSIAAGAGHLHIMEQVKEWGPPDFTSALRQATHSGKLQVVKRLVEWGWRDYDLILLEAIAGRHIPVMIQAKEWGATSYNKAYECADAEDYAEGMALLRSWMS